MAGKLTQDDVSKLYADVYDQIKAGVAEATKLGKAVKFEMADCRKESNINNIILSMCAVDAAKRLGVEEKEENADLSALTKNIRKPENAEFHVITIPCPVLIKSGEPEKKYNDLDTVNMVKIAAEVYQIANADKSKGKVRIQKSALNMQPHGQSVLLKP